MSYFNTLNGFMDNIEGTQNAIDNVKEQGFSSAMNQLEDKYSLIKQKALEGVPDIAGDVLNYTTQGVTALSGTYNTIRALKQSKMAKNLATKIGKKDVKVEDVDKNGLPKLSDTEQELNDRLNRLKDGSLNNDADEESGRITESLKGGAYDTLARQAEQGHISSNSAFDTLNADRQTRGEGPEPEAQPLPAREEPPMTAREIDPATGQDIQPREAVVPRDLTEAEKEIDVEGFTPDEQKAIETANDPDKLRSDLANENARIEEPTAEPSGEVPFEALFPKPPASTTLSTTQRAEALAQTTQEGGPAGGSALLAKIQAGIVEKQQPNIEPESNGASAAEEASKGFGALNIAEGVGGIAGAALSDVQGQGIGAKAARTTGQVINDGLAVKGGVNLAKRGKNLYNRVNGNNQEQPNPENSADIHSGNPQQSSSVVEQHFDETDPEETPKPQLLETETQEAEEVNPVGFEDLEPIKITAQPEEEEDEPKPPSPKPQEEETPKPTDDIEGAADDAVEDVGDQAIKNTGKSLGQTILDTLGADSAGEAALDAIGPIGEIAGLGLMLGGIFHDIFGKKRQERLQQQQEDAAQNKEQAAENLLQTRQLQQGTTGGGIDISSLRNAAGPSSVGIV